MSLLHNAEAADLRVSLIRSASCGDIHFESFLTSMIDAAGQGYLLTVRATAMRKCNVSGGEATRQFGRLWTITPDQSEEAVLRTLLLAALTFEEHEAREKFRIVLGPFSKHPFIPSHT